MYCSCLSLAVKFMAHIKAPHLQLTDSIYSPGQQIMTPAALRNCNRDPCESPRLYVGRYVDLKVLTLAWNCVLVFLFSQPPHLHHLMLSEVINLELQHSCCFDSSVHAQIYPSAFTFYNWLQLGGGGGGSQRCSRRSPHDSLYFPHLAARLLHNVVIYSCFVFNFRSNHHETSKPGTHDFSLTATSEFMVCQTQLGRLILPCWVLISFFLLFSLPLHSVFLSSASPWGEDSVVSHLADFTADWQSVVLWLSAAALPTELEGEIVSLNVVWGINSLSTVMSLGTCCSSTAQTAVEMQCCKVKGRVGKIYLEKKKQYPIINVLWATWHTAVLLK